MRAPNLPVATAKAIIAAGPTGATVPTRPVRHSRETIVFPPDNGPTPGVNTLLAYAEGKTYFSLFSYDGSEFKVEFVDAEGNATIDMSEVGVTPANLTSQTWCTLLYNKFHAMDLLVISQDIEPWVWPFRTLQPHRVVYGGVERWAFSVERTYPQGLPDNEPFRYRRIFSIPQLNELDQEDPAPGPTRAALMGYDASLFDPGEQEAVLVPARFGPFNRAVMPVAVPAPPAGQTGDRNHEIVPYIIPEIG